MKPASVISFVLICLLVEAQGIRLERGFTPINHHDRDVEEGSQNKVIIEAESSGAGSVVPCTGEHCSGRSTRKLLTDATFTATATTATITSSKSTVNGGKPEVEPTPNGGRNEGKNDKFSVEKLENSGQQEEYQDIMDIAGMDYSTAKRKSPIHN
ncbi:hypothetical protein Syun_011189 [Stephania yunnanensis]|uniref:Uncharacterized protein n=1 Tax=Stephania yunnanensis TaxID=152371 RepID=A0AAP0PG88_9MAGN